MKVGHVASDSSWQFPNSFLGFHWVVFGVFSDVFLHICS